MSRGPFDAFMRHELYTHTRRLLLDTTTTAQSLMERIDVLESHLEKSPPVERMVLRLLIAICLEVADPTDSAHLKRAQELRAEVRKETGYVPVALTIGHLRTTVLYRRFVGAGQTQFRHLFYGAPTVTGQEVLDVRRQPEPPPRNTAP